MPGEKILVVDDDPAVLSTLSRFLKHQGYEVKALATGREAQAALNEDEIPLAIVDLKLPDISGLELLAQVRERSPDTEVILFTGLGAMDSAIQALRLGAYDYLVKSELRLPELQSVVERALERRRLSLANRDLVRELKQAQEELARTRARELAQIRRIGETLSRPSSTQELVKGLLDLIWESLPLTMLGIALVTRENGDIITATRYALDTHPSRQREFDQWLAWGLREEAADAPEALAPSPPCPEVVKEKIKARDVTGMVAGGREATFSPEEAELFRIFALQGEAALRNVRLFEEVKRLAIRDGLTGLYNRRHFLEVLAHQVEVSRRYGWPLSLLFLDIDDFKVINDTYGHPEGDLVLQALTRFLQSHLRHADVISRYGGEEFVVLLPQTSLQPALRLAERLRQGIAATPVALSKTEISITVSIGVSSLTGAMTGEDLIKNADAALYKAKQSGKNRVCDIPAA